MSFRVRKKGIRTVDAAMEAWLTNVLVPAMVQQYLAASGQNDNDVLTPTDERVQ